MASRFVKDPEATLDFKFDFAARTNRTGRKDWLSAGEIITARTITAPAGITVASSSITDNGTSITVWLSGGTHNKSYGVTCRITTTSGRVDERTIYIDVRNR